MKISNRKQAELVKSEAVSIAAKSMQEEFEAYFADELTEAYLKLQQVTDALPEDVMNTTLLQDNRLYLYEILMDNSVEDIVYELVNLVNPKCGTDKQID